MALGRARAIVDAARRCLEPFGREPAAAVAELGPAGTRARLGLDAYRFFPRRDLAALLSAAADLQARFGSLEGAFAAGRARPGEGDGRDAPYAGPPARLLAACDRFVDLVLDSARRAALAADGSVHFAGYDARLYTLDWATGAVKWTFLLGDEVRASSPAIAADGTI